MKTGNKPQQPKCALGAAVGYDADKIKRDGWIHQGILVVCADDPRLSETHREMVLDVGLILYGQNRTGVRRHD